MLTGKKNEENQRTCQTQATSVATAVAGVNNSQRKSHLLQDTLRVAWHYSLHMSNPKIDKSSNSLYQGAASKDPQDAPQNQKHLSTFKWLHPKENWHTLGCWLCEPPSLYQENRAHHVTFGGNLKDRQRNQSFVGKKQVLCSQWGSNKVTSLKNLLASEI